MWSLVRHLGRLLHSWWRRDRIRAAPDEGRLLRLTPTSVVIVDGRPAVVVERTTLGDGDPGIVYRCATHDGYATLEVRVRHIGQPCDVRWQENDHGRVLAESDIEAFAADRPHHES